MLRERADRRRASARRWRLDGQLVCVGQRLIAWAAIALLCAGPSIPVVHAGGNPSNGAEVFKACRACHLVGPGAKHTVGPVLDGVVGRRIGSAPGYTYSRGLQELASASGVWTPQLLDAYLADPKSFVPNGKMAFIGLARKSDRDDVIAYLRSLAK